MKSVALIACSNGLGHTRRVLLLANALVNKQLKVTVFAPLNYAAMLNQLDSFKRIKLVDFNTQTSVSSWSTSNSQNWYKLLPDLSEFDIVVSDNLIEILKIRHDAWLSGSFFWHEAIDNFPEKLKKESQNLLLKYRPRMISSAIFSSEKLKKYTNLYEVGLYSNSEKNLSLSKELTKYDVLIACGKGGGLMNKTEDFIKKLSKEKNMILNTVWVEPNLLPKSSPHWMKKATFTNKMYQSLIASVIRPGVGTITDSLLAHSKVFLYYESDNLEMKENSNLVESLGLGVNSIEIDNAWSDVMDYVNNSRLQHEFKRKSCVLNISGAQEAADILASSLNY
jgi:hypothetical protein